MTETASAEVPMELGEHYGRLYLERNLRVKNGMVIKAGKTVFRVSDKQATLVGEKREE